MKRPAQKGTLLDYGSEDVYKYTSIQVYKYTNIQIIPVQKGTLLDDGCEYCAICHQVVLVAEENLFRHSCQ